ncbi:MAG: hypothetical protein LQ343_007647 [Gyalolechia ehrenbergii]|nr:MAG: hypothetical protein LQ343_007647 [Gyalolechia ehrenbergii]
MSEEGALEGACSCGRNHYIILAPPSFGELFSVIYDDRVEHGQCTGALNRQHADLATARSLSLRVPLSHIQSTTHAFYPDETHSTIRRIFTPRHAPQTKRHFCGFCGTSLTHWSEESEADADWVYVNLGSLRSGSVEKLVDEGLLDTADDTNASTANKQKALYRTTTSEETEVSGAPWYEELIEGSELGRLKRKRGAKSSADGRSRVEWEVVEFTSEPGDPGTSTGKRKLDQVGKERDVEMRE